MSMMVVIPWDQERELKTEEYQELASSLVLWLRDATAFMQDRNFPPTLIEMKVGIDNSILERLM